MGLHVFKLSQSPLKCLCLSLTDLMNIHAHMHNHAFFADTLSVSQIFLGPSRLSDLSASAGPS